jgi:hypothetical protein
VPVLKLDNDLIVQSNVVVWWETRKDLESGAFNGEVTDRKNGTHFEHHTSQGINIRLGGGRRGHPLGLAITKPFWDLVEARVPPPRHRAASADGGEGHVVLGICVHFFHNGRDSNVGDLDLEVFVEEDVVLNLYMNTRPEET